MSIELVHRDIVEVESKVARPDHADAFWRVPRGVEGGHPENDDAATRRDVAAGAQGLVRLGVEDRDVVESWSTRT